MKKIQIPTTATRPSGFAMPVCGPRSVAPRTTGYAAVRVRQTGVPTRVLPTVVTDAGTTGHVGLVPANAWGTTAWRPPIS